MLTEVDYVSAGFTEVTLFAISFVGKGGVKLS